MKNFILTMIAFLVVTVAAVLMGWWGLLLIAICSGLIYVGASLFGDQTLTVEERIEKLLSSHGSNASAQAGDPTSMAPSPTAPNPNSQPIQTATAPPQQHYAQPPQYYTQPQQSYTQQGYAQQVQPYPATTPQTIIIQSTATPANKSNGLGTAGFIFSLLSILLSWSVIGGIIVWLLGLIFSFIGLFRKPRGMAIAGFILAVPGLILIIVCISAAGNILGFLA